MTRVINATLSAIIAVASLAMPSLADDATTTDAGAGNSTTAANVASTTESSADKNTDTNDKKALADNSPTGSADAAKDPNAKAAPAKAKSGGNVALPARAASFTAGVLFGTPVAIVRRTHMEISQGEHDLIGDYDKWYKKAAFVFPGLILAVPYGSVSGGLGGCMYSVRNAWKGSKDEPFGKESFSLGDVGN